MSLSFLSMNSLILKLAARNVFRNHRRTLATFVTVTLGSCALLIYQGFNSGMMNEYRINTIHSYYGYGQVFMKSYWGQIQEKPWDLWIETNNQKKDFEKSLLKIPQIKQVFPRVSFFAFLSHNGINLGGHGEGVLPERENLFFDQMNFISGNYLNSEDEIVVGKGLANSLNLKVGDVLSIQMQTLDGQMNGSELKVAGIFHMGIKAIDDVFFRVHLNLAKGLINTEKVESFTLDIGDVSNWKTVQEAIESEHKELEAIPFEILDKDFYQNSIDFLKAQFIFIRIIILLLVALGIFTIVSVGLLERSEEVGVLRANGESRFRLFKIYLLENFFLALIGSIFGIFLAFFLTFTLLRAGVPIPMAPGITRHFLVPIEIQFSNVIEVILLAVLTSIIASLWPIYKLLNRNIPELLRTN